MTGALFRKELKSIRPFLALILFLISVSIFFELTTEQPDFRPMALIADEYILFSEDIYFSSFVSFILVFTLSLRLLIHERDEGTQEFLDSLPVSRTRIFCTKILIAQGILFLLPLSNVVIVLILHALSINSLDPSFHFQIHLTYLFLSFCQFTVFLSIGLALSFLRRFAWVFMGLLIWGYIYVIERAPGVGVLDIFSLTASNFEGQRWILPASQLIVQLPLALVLILIAYLLYLGAGDRISRIYEAMPKSIIGSALLITAGIGVFALGSALIIRSLDQQPVSEYDEEGIAYPEWKTSRTRTARYVFTFPSDSETLVHSLIPDADAIHDRVLAFLQGDFEDPIAGELTYTSGYHAGLAYWEKIRVNLSQNRDKETFSAILGHETAHVYIDKISKKRMSETFNSTRFFHEGLATYLEYRFFRPPEKIHSLRSVAAVTLYRDDVDFRDLVNDGTLQRTKDKDLVYPLGEIFVSALVAVYSDEAPGKILRAFARDDAPRDLEGMTLWQDVFQFCGYNLDDAIDAFYARLDESVDRYRDFVEEVPRLNAALEADDKYFSVRVIGDPGPGWRILCRFRRKGDTPDRHYIYGREDESGTFRVLRALFPGPTFWYQVGIKEADSGAVIYERWIEVPDSL